MIVPSVVLGLGVNGLGVVRSLGRRGIPVVGVYSKQKEVARYSRYCKAIRLSEFDKGEEEYISALCRLGEDLGKAVLYPTSDRYVQIISKYRDCLEPYFLFHSPSEALVEKMNSKNGLEELARIHGVKIPQTRQIHSPEDVSMICDGFHFPVIIKPFMTFTVEGFKTKKNVICDTSEELSRVYSGHPEWVGKTIVQEVIRGGDGFLVMCAIYCGEDSRPLAMCTARKIRQYLPDFGIASFAVSEEVKTVKDITMDFVKKTEFKGMAVFEYAQVRGTEEYYLIEVNLRTTTHNQIYSDSGVNFPYVAYCSLIGNDFVRKEQISGKVWIDFAKDFGSFWRKRKNKEITFSAWIRSLVAARSFAYFAIDDPKPFLVAAGRFFHAASRHLTNRKAYN